MTLRARVIESALYDGLFHEDKNYLGDIIATKGPYEKQYNILNESISSENTQFKRYGNCVHTRIEQDQLSLDLPPQTITACFGKDTPSEYGTRRGNDWCKFHWSGSTPFTFEELDDLAAEYSGEAFEAMIPTLSPNLSLTNFIVELRDIKSMFRIIDSSVGIFKNVAKGHLNYSFAWKPFIGDLLTIYEKASTWRAGLQKLTAGVGKQQTRHFTKVLPLPPTDGPLYTLPPYWRIRDASETVHWRKRPTYCATMKFTYSLPEMSEKEMELRALLDSFGLHFNAGVIWEAIPFSFAVDWFHGIGSWLEQFSEDWLEVNLKIVDFCSSYTFDYSWDQILQSMDKDDDVIGELLLGRTSHRHYRRLRHIPKNFFSVQQSGRYGARQMALSGSLLVALSGNKR